MDEDQRDKYQYDQAGSQNDGGRLRMGVQRKNQDSEPSQNSDIGNERPRVAFERAIRTEARWPAEQTLLGGKGLFNIGLETATITFHGYLCNGEFYRVILITLYRFPAHRKIFREIRVPLDIITA